MEAFETVRNDALRILPKACDIIPGEGFADAVDRLSPLMEQGLRTRASFTYTNQSRRYPDARGLVATLRK